MPDKFHVGDRVFAKLSSWPAWPAKIAERKQGRGESYMVWFYGTYNWSYVNANKIFLFNDESKMKYGNPKNPCFHGWKKALDEVEKNTLLGDWSWLPEKLDGHEEREIAQLRKTLEEKTEEANTSKRSLALEQKLSEKTKNQLNNCRVRLTSMQGLFEGMKVHIKDLTNELKIRSDLLEERRLEIVHLKERNQQLQKIIREREPGINLEEIKTESDSKRKLMIDIKSIKKRKDELS